MPAAPSGDWKTDPIPEAHPCRLPRFTSQDAGREWECQCGQVWILTRKKDQADPPPPDTSWATTTDIRRDNVGRMPDFGEVMSKKGDDGDDEIVISTVHSPDCAHTLKTGMCTCHVRKVV